MPVHLSLFETEIDSSILMRGQTYYKQKLVQECFEVDTNEYTALVEGSEVYEVYIKIKDDEVIEHRCDCPYDLGPFCKHEVAVLFTIRNPLHKTQDVSSNRNADKNYRRNLARTKQKTVVDQIYDALVRLSEETLKEIVMEYAKSDRQFCALLLRRVPIPPEVDKKDLYKRQIQDCIHAFSDRHGFVNYSTSHQAIEAAEDLFVRAQTYSDSKKYSQTLEILQAILEELYPALQRVDDSDGDFGRVIDETWGLMNQVVEQFDPKSKDAQNLFHYFLSQAQSKIYEGWDAEWNFYEIVSKLIADDEMQKLLFQKLDQAMIPKRDSEDDCQKEFIDFEKKRREEKAVQIKIDVLNRRGKQEDTQKLTQEYLYLASVREKELEKAFVNKDFSYAKKLAYEGILQAQKDNFLGIVHQFTEWLLKIAEAENDIENIRRYLLQFFYEHGELTYFDRLKKTYSEFKQWQIVIELIIGMLKITSYRSYSLFEVLIREERWQEFLEQIQIECKKETHYSYTHDESLHLLDRYHEPLASHFPKELSDLYTQEIETSL